MFNACADAGPPCEPPACEVAFISRPPPQSRALRDESEVIRRLRALFARAAKGDGRARDSVSARHEPEWVLVVVSDARPPRFFDSIDGLIAVHGAALANVFRMPLGAPVVEIGSAPAPRLCYAAVAKGRGLKQCAPKPGVHQTQPSGVHQTQPSQTLADWATGSSRNRPASCSLRSPSPHRTTTRRDAP